MGGPPKDGGWGWIVAAGCFINMFLIIGQAKSMGIIFVSLREYYNKTATATAALYPLIAVMSLFMAPITTRLAHRFGCRRICMLGSLLIFIGTIISSFGTTLEAVIYPYGVIAGLGVGMLLNPGPMVISEYFEEKKALGMGILFTGSGLGGIVGPYIVHLVLSEFGLHQALLMFAAISFHSMIGASLFRPLSFWKKPQSLPVVDDSEPDLKKVIAVDADIGDGDKKENSSQLLKSINNKINHGTDEERETYFMPAEHYHSTRASHIQQQQKLTTNRNVVAMRGRKHLDSFGDVISLRSADSASIYLSALSLVSQSDPFCIEHGTHHSANSLHHDNASQHDLEGESKTNISSTNRIKACLSKLFRCLNLRLFTRVPFMMYCLASAVGQSGFYLNMLTPAYTEEELGFPQYQATTLISIIGVGDLSGRMTAGLLGDRAGIKPYRVELYGVMVLFIGVATAFCPYAISFWGQAFVLVCASACFGFIVTLGPVALGDVVDKEDLAAAWGFLLFFQGIGHFSTPLMIGIIKDWTGFYYGGYLFISIASASGALMILLIDVHKHFCQ